VRHFGKDLGSEVQRHEAPYGFESFMPGKARTKCGLTGNSDDVEPGISGGRTPHFIPSAKMSRLPSSKADIFFEDN
jgi:hypothetical protein